MKRSPIVIHASPVIAKCIKVFVKPGHMEDFLAAQRIWNEHSRRADGYLGEFVGRDPAAPDIVHVHLCWRSREDLARFMAEGHDRIAVLARADEHYDRIEVRVLDAVDPATTGLHGTKR